MAEENFKEFPAGVAALIAVFLLALVMSSIGFYQFFSTDFTEGAAVADVTEQSSATSVEHSE